MSNHLAKIFDAWDGNAEAMATDIEELGVTVRQWRNRGDIPSRAWPKIIKAAAELRGRELRLEDFLRPEVVSELPAHALTDKAEWPVSSAGNSGEISGSEAPAGEADSPRPFAPTSATCSQTSAPSPSSQDSQASSTTGAEAA